MNTTKKSFLKAGAIVAIVMACFTLFSGISIALSFNLINEKTIIDTITYELDADYYEDAEGNYYIEYFEDEDDIRPERIEQEDIKTYTKLAKVFVVVASIVVIGVAIAQYIFGVKILKNLKKNISKKGHIITLLVLSILTNTMVTMAFMIVALCIKDTQKVTLQNINEIASQSGEQLTIDQLEQEEQNKEEK